MLDNMDIGRILRRALAGGGEFADLYYEEGASTGIVCEDPRQTDPTFLRRTCSPMIATMSAACATW